MTTHSNSSDPSNKPWPHIIYNSLTSTDLSVTALSGYQRVTNITATRVNAPGAPPAVLDRLISSVATQINDSRSFYAPAFKAVDLHNMIADVIIETSAQGASLLEVHVIDPYWVLLRRNKYGWSFIDVDFDTGYLYPPIEINFPPDVSDATWRLAAVKPTTDLTQANIVMIFEDKIVAEMREHTATASGTNQPATDPSLAASTANETRAEFIKRCIETVGKNTLLPSEVPIRFRPLLPHSDFTPADLVGSEVTLPKSATQPHAPPQRQNANKNPDIVTGVGNAIARQSVEQQVGNTIVSLAAGTLDGNPPSAVPGTTGSGGILGPMQLGLE